MNDVDDQHAFRMANYLAFILSFYYLCPNHHRYSSSIVLVTGLLSDQLQKSVGRLDYGNNHILWPSTMLHMLFI